MAVLVARRGVELDLEQIAEGVAGSLAKFKQPQKLIVLPELPRNTMGKVQKNVLRENYRDLFQPE